PKTMLPTFRKQSPIRLSTRHHLQIARAPQTLIAPASLFPSVLVRHRSQRRPQLPPAPATTPALPARVCKTFPPLHSSRSLPFFAEPEFSRDVSHERSRINAALWICEIRDSPTSIRIPTSFIVNSSR